MQLNQIVNEKRSITADTAKALGTIAEFWMNLQSRNDLDQARDESGSIVEEEVHSLPVGGQ